jgi:hypothetical protein
MSLNIPVKFMAMSCGIMLDLLKETWLAYLLKQGHRITDTPESIIVIRSRNGSKRSYRWLLMTAEGPERAFGDVERVRIREEIADASRAKEKAFLVLGCAIEPRRIIAVPASSALASGVVRSDRGGIAWDD